MSKGQIVLLGAVIVLVGPGCNRPQAVPPGGTSRLYQVVINLKSSQDCYVSSKREALGSQDQIRWCAKNPATNYYIKFIDTGNGFPLRSTSNTTNDFLVNKNSVDGWVCTDQLEPFTDAPHDNTEYTYIIQYSKTSCDDPKVILK